MNLILHFQVLSFLPVSQTFVQEHLIKNKPLLISMLINIQVKNYMKICTRKSQNFLLHSCHLLIIYLLSLQAQYLALEIAKSNEMHGAVISALLLASSVNGRGKSTVIKFICHKQNDENGENDKGVISVNLLPGNWK